MRTPHWPTDYGCRRATCRLLACQNLPEMDLRRARDAGAFEGISRMGNTCQRYSVMMGADSLSRFGG